MRWIPLEFGSGVLVETVEILPREVLEENSNLFLAAKTGAAPIGVQQPKH
jgi:hypothetical protein